MALAKGSILEKRYRIDGLISRGGMGAIYLGFDLKLKIRVAIKENFFLTPQSIAQFEREALLLARLHHPNLPRVSDHFSLKDQQYLVMDFIEGQDLQQLTETQGTLNEAQALDYIIQICDAVGYLHQQHPPIVHRDIKPQNIKITSAGQAMLVDFGIAKVLEDDSNTHTGAKAVTPGFSPPEQYGGLSGTTPVSDVYSLGATLYAVLTGKKPPDSLRRLAEAVKFEPPDAVNPKLSHQIADAIIYAMQPRPEDRPQSMANWQKQLAAITDTPTQLQTDNRDTDTVEDSPAGWLVGPQGRTFPLKVGNLTLGRAAECDIHVEDLKASRRHARLDFDGVRYTAYDLGSANGTFVNDQQVGPAGHPLNSGDHLRIGDSIFSLSLLKPESGRNAAVQPVSGPSAPSNYGPTSHLPLPAQQSSPQYAQPVEAAPQKSSGVLMAFLAVFAIIVVIGLGIIGFLIWQRTDIEQELSAQATFAALAAVATQQAQEINATPNLNTEATLDALAAIATEQAQEAGEVVEIDTEATIAAAVNATEQAKASLTPPTPTATPVVPTATSAPPTSTSVPSTATSVPTATPTSKPTAAPVSAAPLGVFQNFENQSSAWKRGDEPNGELKRVSNQFYDGSYAGQLDYNFPSSSNDYVVFLQHQQLAGNPNAISAWVYGDGAGHFLNVWIKDANGQTWQMSFGQVRHTGWQKMTAILDPNQPWPSGHINGPDNNKIEYPISFEGLVLDDGSDGYSGRGTIYLDNLTSEKEVEIVASTSTPVKSVTTTPPTPVSTGNYKLVVGKHLYESWGAPWSDDICQAFRDQSFNDKVVMKGFNLELKLTNNSTQRVADDWAPEFVTAKGKNMQVCYYGYAGSGPPPDATASMTFFTIVTPDDYVRVVTLDVNGETVQICLDPSGAQTPC